MNDDAIERLIADLKRGWPRDLREFGDRLALAADTFHAEGGSAATVLDLLDEEFGHLQEKDRELEELNPDDEYDFKGRDRLHLKVQRDIWKKAYIRRRVEDYSGDWGVPNPTVRQLADEARRFIENKNALLDTCPPGRRGSLEEALDRSKVWARMGSSSEPKAT